MAAVTAHCTNCNDEHLLGDRRRVPGTTACPCCDDTSYRTDCDGDAPKPDSERIVDAIDDVDGVGDDTITRIVHRYDYYAELEAASVDELTEIKNVGATVAERIQDAT